MNSVLFLFWSVFNFRFKSMASLVVARTYLSQGSPLQVFYQDLLMAPYSIPQTCYQHGFTGSYKSHGSGLIGPHSKAISTLGLTAKICLLPLNPGRPIKYYIPNQWNRMQISAIALPFCREYLIHVLQSIGPWKLHQDGRIIYFHEFIYYLLVKYQKTSIALYTISLILLKE